MWMRWDTRDFDAVGRVKTETDEVGRVTRHTYDSGGGCFERAGRCRCRSSIPIRRVDSSAASSRPCFASTRGTTREATATQSAPTRWDFLHRRRRQPAANGDEYDAHGMRTRKTRTDGTYEVYRYDAADRLVRVDESSGKVSQYGLDGVGNRTSLTVTQPGVPTTTTTSISNAFNQLTSSTRTSGLQSLTTTSRLIRDREGERGRSRSEGGQVREGHTTREPTAAHTSVFLGEGAGSGWRAVRQLWRVQLRCCSA